MNPSDREAASAEPETPALELARAETWPKYTAALIAAGLGDATFGYFARTLPLVWPKARMDEPLEYYLGFSWDELLFQRNIGKGRRVRLWRCLKAIAEDLKSNPGVEPGEKPGANSAAAVGAAFEAFGIPMDYPVAATSFSARVMKFAERHGCDLLFDLTCLPAPSGSGREVAHFGRGLRHELELWRQALAARDRSALRAFVPVGGRGQGLDLGTMVRLAVGFSARGMARALHRRLMGGLSAKAAGDSIGVTGATLRKAEAVLLWRLDRFLDCMPELKGSLLAEWDTTGKIGPIASAEPAGIRALAATATARIFMQADRGRGGGELEKIQRRPIARAAAARRKARKRALHPET
jgi:hypothetical protein